MKTSAETIQTRKNTGCDNSNDDGQNGSNRNSRAMIDRINDIDSSNDMDRAMDIWLNLRDSIHRLIDKIISFNSSYGRDDYIQEAFLACVKAVGNYSRMRKAKIETTYSKEFIDMASDLRKNRKLVWMIEGENGDGLRVSTCKNEPKMKPEVFAYWYIEKILFRVASGSKEVVFHIYNEHGEYERTVNNSEFRKIKKKLEKEGFTVKSDNIFRDISFFNDVDEDSGTSHEFIDENFTGFNPEVKEMLRRDMNRFYKGVQKQQQ